MPDRDRPPTGNRSVNTEPSSITLCSSISPPCSRAISRAKASPRPLPRWSDSWVAAPRKNLSKTLGCSSSGMPGPLSSTSMRIQRSSAEQRRLDLAMLGRVLDGVSDQVHESGLQFVAITKTRRQFGRQIGGQCRFAFVPRGRAADPPRTRSIGSNSNSWRLATIEPASIWLTVSSWSTSLPSRLASLLMTLQNSFCRSSFQVCLFLKCFGVGLEVVQRRSQFVGRGHQELVAGFRGDPLLRDVASEPRPSLRRRRCRPVSRDRVIRTWSRAMATLNRSSLVKHADRSEHSCQRGGSGFIRLVAQADQFGQITADVIVLFRQV